MSRVEARMAKVSHQLESFLEQVKAPSLSIINEVDNIATAVIQELRDDGLINKFHKQYKESFGKLRDQLKSARPCFLLKTPGIQRPSITIDDDTDENKPAIPRPSPSKFRKGMDGRAVKTEEPVSSTPPSKKLSSLMDVRKLYERGSNSGIPNQSNPKVTERIILDSLQDWRTVVTQFLNNIQRLLENMLTSCINQYLASWKQTMVYREANRSAHNLFANIMNEQRTVVGNIVACETYKPVTYSDIEQKAVFTKAELSSQRLKDRTEEYFDMQDAKTSKITKLETRNKKMSEDAFVKDTLKNDPYSREIDSKATVLAYYDTALIGMTDTIAKYLEYGLIGKLEKELKQTLFDQLDFTNSEYCAQLLADDPQREQARQHLVEVQAKLDQAWQELRGLTGLN